MTMIPLYKTVLLFKLNSYFLSSFYIQNSLPLINTNTKYCKQIVIFPLKGATFSISVPRQHPAPRVNGIFLPTIAVLPLWSGGGGGESTQSISQNNSNHSIPQTQYGGICINILKFFIMLFMYYDIKMRSKKPCHYRLFLLNLMLVTDRQARYVYYNIYL
jgi:hypothetical protein